MHLAFCLSVFLQYCNGEVLQPLKPATYSINAIVVEIDPDGTQRTTADITYGVNEGGEACYFAGEEVVLPVAGGKAQRFEGAYPYAWFQSVQKRNAFMLGAFLNGSTQKLTQNGKLMTVT
ncbi:MAG: hypothetical protein ACJ8FY_06000 [Gemmataceae bacterium]